MPRLTPIDRPRNLLIRLGSWLSKRKLGVAIAPLRVVYPRMPALARPQLALLRLAERLSLPHRLKMLVEIAVSVHNGCSFCSDLHAAMALDAGVDAGDLAVLHAFEDHPERFSAPERAALAWSLAVTAGTTDDALFARLGAELPDEVMITELTWLAAFTGYLNAMAVALELESDGLCALRAPAVARALPAHPGEESVVHAR